MDQQFPVLCAWCGAELGHTSVSNSHGICHSCFEQLLGIPLLSETQLDGLPFGAIELDAHGTVLAYNATEQALSGFTPNSVIGKNFFEEVAPCTRVAEFQGRFSGFVHGESEPESFSFTFPFARGAVDVTIAFVRSERESAFVLVRAHERATVSA